MSLKFIGKSFLEELSIKNSNALNPVTTSIIRTEVVSISPDMARNMLETSTGNRKIRNTHMRYLSDAMSRGEWNLTHQGIAFDEDGVLKDGHHRLTACVDSGVTIKSMVTYGVPRDSVIVFDTGAARSFADKLSLKGNVSTTLRLGCELIYGRGFTVQMARPLIDSGFVERIESLYRHCNSGTKVFSTASVSLAAVVAAIEQGDSSYAFGQYRALATQNYDDMTGVSKSLSRQVVAGGLTLGGAQSRTDPIARALYVFDVKNKNARILRITDDYKVEAIKRVQKSLLGLIPNYIGEFGQ